MSSSVVLPCVANALDMVDAILHRLLRRQTLVLSHRILVVCRQVAAVVRHPEMLPRVCFVVPFPWQSYSPWYRPAGCIFAP